MPSTFFGLNIAYSGLLASNAWQNTTANNIANVQTEGYSRQKVVQESANALRVFQTFGCAGAGVETLAVERIRDEFYDYRFWNNNAKLGEYDMKQYYMKQIEAYFDDNGANAGFKTVFDQMMITGLQAWKNNSGDTSHKEQFIGYAETLAEYFNNVSGNLQKLQKDVNQEIKLKVDEINSIAGEIATLNKQINTIELTGVNANELRDKRALLIDELSEIVDVSVSETPIMDANNPERETGANRYMVKIAGGQILVDGNDYEGLECVARKNAEKVHQSDIDGLYDVVWSATGQKFNMYAGGMGGDLKGLIDIRDGNNNENFNGTVGSIDKILDDQNNETGDYTVTVNVTKPYLTDLNKCNLSDQGGVINLANKEFNYDSWTYNVSFNNDGEAVYSYTFVLKQDADKNADLENGLKNRQGVEAKTGVALAFQGVPYYMVQMNEWVRTFSQKINDILCSGYSGTQKGCQLFVGDYATDDKQYSFPDGTDAGTANSRYDLFVGEIKAQIEAEKKKLMDANPALSEADALTQAVAAVKANVDTSFSVSVRDDSYYQLTALNMNVLSALRADPDKLANKYKEGDGPEQSDLIDDIKDLATDKSKMSFRNSSASEFLQCILSDVTLNTSRSETFYKSFKDVSYSVETQRASVSGVDEDEEAVNLVKYQFSYNLACKMISTLSEMYDRLILQTGV